ncbi:MAG: YafY family transcriptional regulator [Defluviitaleaceae bacterium]|nr:YafY family transcriptional regulator [Defluviitaleaceae bacterium]
MQSTRLFEIIYLLLNKKSTTAKELAERFGVSTRTIYRDVDVLSLAGIPVYTEKGKNGGISLLPDYVLNKSILSEGEQKEILSALQGLSLIGDGEAGQVLKRLSAIFNNTAADWLEVDFSGWDYNKEDIFGGFKTAILERRIAEFDYYSSFGELTHRRIEPIQLWFKSKAWYIKGFCLEKQDVRLFKLVRVSNLIITSETFTERDLLATPPNPGRAVNHRPDVTLCLHIAPEMTFRVHDEFDTSMVEKQPDGSYIATVTWPEDNWVYGFILSFGEYIQVLSPPHIKEIIKSKAQKIMDKY